MSEDLDLYQDPSARAVGYTERILQDAIIRQVSDIHMQWTAKGVVVRFRESGLLVDYEQLSSDVGRKVISHLKVLANMNIADRRRPQDGRIIYHLNERSVDLRLATAATLYGENLTMRVFDKSASYRRIEQLGLEPSDLERVKNLVRSPHGLVLVTGPTGAGKTTTLYGLLEYLNDTSKNIITVEDPIEYDIDRVNQISVNRPIGLDYAAILRSVFRHDPDIIMIGEIRDPESALIAVRAALSGHLVFATLHTGSALGAFTNLVQLGVSPYLASSALLGVITQQLIRATCSHCRERYEFPLESLAPVERREYEMAMECEGVLPGASPSFAVGVGCEQCRGTGFSGRLGLFEIFEVSPKAREALASGAPRSRLETIARANGWRSLQLAGFCKIVRGEATIEEVLRVVHLETEADVVETQLEQPAR
ncbi:MAG: GspE/PulE family protein [Planctomycetota bacterium]